MGSRSLVLGIAVLSACAPRASTTTTPVLAPEPTQTALDGPLPGASAETYLDLLRQVAAREAQTTGLASACLLERVDNQLRFSGSPTLAIRPVPMPGVDLDPRLERSVSVNVLTAYGRYGEGTGGLSLASFTYAQPTREALALIVTDLGVYIRGVDARLPVRNRLTREVAVETVVQLQPATVFVAAEAQVSTPVLAELLTALNSQRVPVALAVDLPSDAALPRAPSGAAPRTCADGLPESSEPDGVLTPEQLAAPIAQLRARGVDCIAGADARGAAGGRVRLMLRVASSGMVAQACISADDTGDARLLGCIVSEAQKLRFPPPVPKGSVDLELPLALQPALPPAPPLLCDAQLDDKP